MSTFSSGGGGGSSGSSGSSRNGSSRNGSSDSDDISSGLWSVRVFVKLTILSVSGKIIRFVADQGHGSSVYIHRGLLVKSCDYLEGLLAADNDPFDDAPVTIQTDVTYIAMDHFGQFLYTSQLKPSGESFKTMTEILAVYKWTKHHLCVGAFRDALTNEAIKLLTNGLTYDRTHEIVRAFLNDFEDIDGGLSMLLVDWIVRSPFIGSYIYAEINACLSGSNDGDRIHRAFAQAFLDANSDEEGKSRTPWLANQCQYHEHLPVTSCSPKVPATPGIPKGPLTPVPPKPPVKPNTMHNTRFGSLNQDFDGMAIDEEDEIMFETPSKKARPAASESWTNTERIHLLNLAMSSAGVTWSGFTNKHNQTFWAARGSMFERSVGGLKAEFKKHMGTSDRDSVLSAIPAKVDELEKKAAEAALSLNKDLSEAAFVDDDDSETIVVTMPKTNKNKQKQDSWTDKEKINLLRLFYDNPEAPDQEIADAHNGGFWAGNQERSAAEVAKKYEETIGIGRKLTALRKIPGKIAQLEEADVLFG